MSSWKVRLLAVLTAVAMLLAVSGPAVAQGFGNDCDFVGYDAFGNAVFVCDTGFNNFNNFNNGFFFDPFFTECLGLVIGNECLGLEESVFF